MTKLLLLVAALAACASSNDSSPADRELCTKLRGHVIDVRLAGMTNDVEAHRAAFASSLGDDFVDGCQKSFSIHQVNCALQASDADAVESCTRSGGPHGS